ncbi:tetratricopeptide repeat protein [Flavobacteriales bacterium]|nr:tetratricopeptide repeat protein [Flavobacteriales bacterium]
MKKIFLLYLVVFYHSVLVFSQTIDSTGLDTIETQFSDSIALINEQNERLKSSRDAYNAGLLLLEAENYIDAIHYFTNAITIDSIFSKAYLSRARCYEGSDYELARADYLKSFEFDSSDFSPLYSLADLQFQLDKELAKQTYNTLISLSREEYMAFSQLGIIAFLAKDYHQAEQLFTQSLDINTTAYTLNDRGSCYRKLEQFDEAIQDYLAAIDLNSDLSFIYSNLASIYAKQGDSKEALNYYDIAIRKDAKYALAYNNKASLLLENKEYQRAEFAIEKALVANPEYAPAFNNRGVLNHQYKKYKEAIIDFDKAIQIDDNYAKAYLNRGISKQMIRDENGACLDWNKAKELGIMLAKKYLANDCE